MVAIAEVKGVMPQADPHFYHGHGDGHALAHEVPGYQQDAYANAATDAPATDADDATPTA